MSSHSAPISIYYLEQTNPGQLRAKPAPQGLAVAECVVKHWPMNRFLYQWVGGPWRWVDKLVWTEQQWQDYVNAPQLRTWVACVQGSLAGYYELQRQPDDAVEIMYFGLTPDFVGAGYGGYLLTHALSMAWEWRARVVRVNTCSLDHPAALANYQARGMVLVDTVEKPSAD